MDGVLSDFDSWKNKYFNHAPPQDNKKFWEEAEKCKELFWRLEPMPDYMVLMTYLYSLNVPLSILTALPRKSSMPEAEEEKKRWIRKYLGDIEFNVGPYAVDKQRRSGAGQVLIDDKQINIDQWKAKGGIGILHTSAEDTIKQLIRILNS